MAANSCPECGGKVSSKAMKCPHCGHPITFGAEGFDSVKSGIGSAFNWIIILITIAVIFALVKACVDAF